MSTPAFPEGCEHLWRELAPQVLGFLLHRYRDFSTVEDAVQEALLAAIVRWPRDGVPDQPRAWLITVAKRRMTDHIRQEVARRRREAEAAQDPELAPPFERGPGDDEDDTLRLLFLCCHPALSQASAIALTLRAVGGLTTAEIAKAFLVPEATMAQRIHRAKLGLRAAITPGPMPAGDERRQRAAAVMHVLYLMFNEGYVATSGSQVQRLDLAREAIRLARLLHHLMPAEPEAAGLLALMLLTDARRKARTGPAQELISLAQQDRRLWDTAAIAEATALLTAALPKGAIGPYQLQAAIAAVHAEAPCAEQTDWPQILALYELLNAIADNPVVQLNHAIALAMVRGPAAGLVRLDALDRDGRLAGHHRLHATRAHLLERAGDADGAATYYRMAANLTASQPERIYLLMQAARLKSPQK